VTSQRVEDIPEDARLWDKVHDLERRLSALELRLTFVTEALGGLQTGNTVLSELIRHLTDSVTGLDKKLDIFITQQTTAGVAEHRSNRLIGEWVRWIIPIIVAILIGTLTAQNGGTLEAVHRNIERR
jgi:hypothetical protein